MLSSELNTGKIINNFSRIQLQSWPSHPTRDVTRLLFEPNVEAFCGGGVLLTIWHHSKAFYWPWQTLRVAFANLSSWMLPYTSRFGQIITFWIKIHRRSKLLSLHVGTYDLKKMTWPHNGTPDSYEITNILRLQQNLKIFHFSLPFLTLLKCIERMKNGCDSRVENLRHSMCNVATKTPFAFRVCLPSSPFTLSATCSILIGDIFSFFVLAFRSLCRKILSSNPLKIFAISGCENGTSTVCVYVCDTKGTRLYFIQTPLLPPHH